MSFFEWLGFGSPSSSRGTGDTDAIRRIADALGRLEPDQARYIAAFAYLLGRVACTDREVSVDETAAMERIVRDLVGLPADQAVLVVQIAKSQNLLSGGTDDFLVAREFERMATREQKLALLECLFAVSASDRSVSVIEDNEISRIAQSLKLEHSDVVKARLAFKDHLSVLKRPERETDV